MSNISHKALLANLRISQWTGRKLDKRATGTVESTHSTEHKVGNYTKKLLPGAKQLENIQRLSAGLRVFFYEQTLPWCADGSRIISSKNYLDFIAAFNTKKAEFDQAVSDFLNDYLTLKEQSKIKLGDLFQENEYPSLAYLQQCFSCDLTFMPVPDVGDFRVALSDVEKQAFIDSMRSVEKQAVKECYNRMHEVVSKAAAKLNDPDAIFRDSLIDNIRDICTLMPKLNVTDDPQLESVRIEVEKIALSINVEACREIGVVRNEAATKLADITSKMSAFMVA